MKPTAYLRIKGTTETTLQKFGPKYSDHPSIGEECPACGQPFVAGDLTTLIPLGPGYDVEAQEKARRWPPFQCRRVGVPLGVFDGPTIMTAPELLPVPPAVSEYVWEELRALGDADGCSLASVRALLSIGLGGRPTPARLQAVAESLRLLADEFEARAEL